MAQLPYSEGVASVKPDEGTGDDYQHVQASPSSFGGLTAQGEQKLGEGVTRASDNLFDLSQFYGKISVDDQINKLMTVSDHIRKGDPSKMVPGPNRQMVPDTGYMGLTGRNALDARAGVEKSLDDAIDVGRKNLKSDYERYEYDTQSRRLRSYWSNEIGTHADTQYKTWVEGVNNAGATHALSHIASTADDDQQFQAGASDLINFRVQQAQLKYGDDPKVAQTAIELAKRDAWKARLEAISVKDPARAYNLTEQLKSTLGADYEPLANQFRARKEMQTGNAVADQAIHEVGAQRVSGPVAPASLKGAILGQESGGDPNAPTSVNGAVGPGQIIPATFKQYAQPGEDINKPEDNLRVSGRIIDDYIKRYNGDVERVAVAYFSGPGNVAPEGSPTPYIKNTSDGNRKSVASYVNDVTARLSSGSPASSMKADAYKMVMNRTDINDAERAHAFTRISQVSAAAQIAADANEKQKRELNETAAKGFVSEMIGGKAGPDIIDRIATNRDLTYQTQENLYAFASQKMGLEDPVQYGPGYTEAYARIFHPLDDKDKITDINQILQMGLPGGGLTPRGVDRLAKIFTESFKQPDQASLNQAKASMLNYVRDEMARTQLIPGMGNISRNLAGEKIFNSEFVPQFEQAFDRWLKAGKDPYEFLQKKNIEEMMNRIYPASKRNADALKQQGEESGVAVQKVPEAPEGVDPKGWEFVITRTPTSPKGVPVPYDVWASAINKLRSDPSEEMKRAFDRKLAPQGITADWVLDHLKKQEAGGQTPEQTMALPPGWGP